MGSNNKDEPLGGIYPPEGKTPEEQAADISFQLGQTDAFDEPKGEAPPPTQPFADPPLTTPPKARKLRHNDGKLGGFLRPTGLDNRQLREKQPTYAKAPCEHVIGGSGDSNSNRYYNNTYIVLGRDRDSTFSSGYGGKGHTRSGAIDIVVGLQGWSPGEKGEMVPINPDKPNGKKAYVGGYAHRNFGGMDDDRPGDAARIYISQRADIDKYFGINCNVGVPYSVAQSAIGMKADDVRIMARRGIKLVTGRNPPGRDSIDGKIKVIYGIDLIAGNMDMKKGSENRIPGWNDVFGRREVELLQPIPKGLALVEYLTKIHEHVHDLNSVLSGVLRMAPFIAVSAQIANYLHLFDPIYGGPTFRIQDLSADLARKWMFNAHTQMAKLANYRAQMITDEINYLTPKGALWVCSRYNRTN